MCVTLSEASLATQLVNFATCELICAVYVQHCVGGQGTSAHVIEQQTNMQ